MSKSKLRIATKGLNTLEEIDENNNINNNNNSCNADDNIEYIDEFPQTNFDENDSTVDSENIYPQKLLSNRAKDSAISESKTMKIPSRSSSSMSTAK